MPNNQALQVFYGTVPLLLAIAAYWFRESMLLKDILRRLGTIEERMGRMEEWMRKVEGRLAVLETRAGIIFHQ